MDIAKFQNVLKLVYGDIAVENLIEKEEFALEIQLPEEQVPLFIGRGGRNIKAVRELLYLYNKLHQSNYTFTLIENADSVVENTEENTESEAEQAAA